jgi:hypothetical protein
MPPTGTASGMVLPSTSAPVNRRHTGSVSRGATTTTQGRLRLCSVHTFYYASLWQRSLRGWRHGLSLGEGSGLLGSRRSSFFSCCRAVFISLPGQVRRFPAQYIIGGQSSMTTKLHVLFEKDFHLQA